VVTEIAIIVTTVMAITSTRHGRRTVIAGDKAPMS
jgi:hypothetical protein